MRAHGRRFIKKGMCRMRRGYASSGGLAQVLQMQGSGALTHHVFQGAQRSMRRRESWLHSYSESTSTASGCHTSIVLCALCCVTSCKPGVDTYAIARPRLLDPRYQM